MNTVSQAWSWKQAETDYEFTYYTSKQLLTRIGIIGSHHNETTTGALFKPAFFLLFKPAFFYIILRFISVGFHVFSPQLNIIWWRLTPEKKRYHASIWYRVYFTSLRVPYHNLYYVKLSFHQNVMI